MDIVVKGRHTEVSDRFRRHVLEKLAKVERLAPKVTSVDVEVSRERNPRQADQSERIELTCRSRGPVIRAEACAHDPYAALDLAWAKLEGRLRRVADRRRVHHKGKSPVSVAVATAPLGGEGPPGAQPPDVQLPGARHTAVPDDPEARSGDPAVEATADPASSIGLDGDGPMVIREKRHRAAPMSLGQALYEMELVGHDFFLFVDASAGCPSVVYRRRAYDYGVIRLDVEPAERPVSPDAAGPGQRP